VVLIALTVALARAKHSLVRNLRRVLPYIYKVSGVLLVVAGAYVAYYGWYELRVRDGDTSGGGAAQVVFDWNKEISNWVQDVGPVRVGIVLAAAVGVVIALTMGTRSRPRGRDERPSRPVEPDSE
jgi:cytochrome c-type biogenesis protein